MAATPPSDQDQLDLQQGISRALKTVARNVLLLLYRERFSQTHRRTSLWKAVQGNKKAMKTLYANQQLLKIIKNNIEDSFDITALYFILRNVCDFSPDEEAWNSANADTIEGNIEKLKDLRNDDAHWTEESYSNVDLESVWQQLVAAINKILMLADLNHRVPKVMKKLQKIRKPGQVKPSQSSVRESLRQELQEQYWSGDKTTLMPLLWGGRNMPSHYHVDKTFTPVRLTTVRPRGVEEVDGERLWEGAGNARVVVLEGETGTGKTSLLRHYAASWATGHPRSGHTAGTVHPEYVILMDLTTSFATFNVASIIQYVFPKTSGDWNKEEIIKELVNSGESVRFMIDAIDERIDELQDGLRELLRTLPEATFLLATRPHCTQAVVSLSVDPCAVVTARGFSRPQAEQYVKKLFKAAKTYEDPNEFLKIISKYEELITIPQLLCWSALFWFERKTGKIKTDKPTTRGDFFRHVTDFMLKKMCYIHGMRIISASVPTEGQQWLSAVAEFAFKQAKDQEASYTLASSEIQELFATARQIRPKKLRPQEALSSLMQCDSSMKADGEHVVFQFIHRSHADYLVAYHLFQAYDTKKKLENALRQIRYDRQRSVMAFFVNLLFNLSGDPPKPLLQKIGSVCKSYAKFSDVNYYLELIEESNHNKSLSSLLGNSVPDGPNVHEYVDEEAVETKMYKNVLWLRPREIRHDKALLLLLTQAKPNKLWLRMCEGPGSTYDRPVRGHQLIRQNPMEALSLVTRAYNKSHLQELKLSHCKCSSNLNWPHSLKSLVIQQCTAEDDFKLPSAKEICIEESCIKGEMRFVEGTEVIRLWGMFVHDVHFPKSLKLLILENCIFLSDYLLPSGVEIMKFSNVQFLNHADTVLTRVTSGNPWKHFETSPVA